MAAYSPAYCSNGVSFPFASELALKNGSRSCFLLSSKGQSQLHGGLSLRPVMGFKVRKSCCNHKISCLRETKAAVVTGKTWDELILNSALPVLVEFHASWCGPCRMVHRVIDEIAMQYSGRLNCFVLYADNDTDIAESYDIKAVPVVLLFKNGVKHDYIVGTMPKEYYVAAIERMMAS